MKTAFYRTSALLTLALTNTLPLAVTIAAPTHKTPATSRASGAMVAPSGEVAGEPFTWSRSYHAGTSYDFYMGNTMSGKTYGGQTVSKDKSNYLRVKFNAIHPGTDADHSEEVQLLIKASKTRDGIGGEPHAMWVLTDMKGVQGLASVIGTSKPVIFKVLPFWQLYQAGTYQPGNSFTVSEPVSLTQTRTTTLTYRGMQKVGAVNCAYFEYSDHLGGMSGASDADGLKGGLWIDPRDGVYRYVKVSRVYEFRNAEGSGTATSTKLMARL